MKYLKITAILLMSCLLVACSSNTKTSSNSNTAKSSSATSKTRQINSHKIIVTIAGKNYTASLNDSQASQSLLKQLPLEQAFRNYGSGFDEKITDLKQPIDYKENENSHDPQAGDIAYWAPDNRLVFYWGDVAEYSGIHVIGRFEDASAAEAIHKINKNQKIQIRSAD